MSNQILQVLSDHFKIDITQRLAEHFNRMVLQFEIRDEHPMTLNSQMFGVNKFIFGQADRDLFFDIIGIEEDDVSQAIHHITSIDRNFKVVSDEFNLMSVFLAHLLLKSKLHPTLKHTTVVNVLNYMQYRFMGSAVNHYFPHGANYEIMQSVIESLSLKFAIRQAGSWKKVMTDRSESLAFDTRAHKDTLTKFNVDKDILYLISDTSTRIRSQLKIITSEYYILKEANNFILSHSSTTTLDGEKVLREKDGSFEMMVHSIFHKILNKSAFIDDRYIKMVQASVPRLNTSIIKRMLITIADEAKNQMQEDTTTKVIHKRDGTDMIIGIEALVAEIVYLIYSSAIYSDGKVNINSKISVYTNTKNLFSAARTTNERLLNVKMSVIDFLGRTRISKRESTVSGLTVALALYINLMSYSSL